VREKRHLGHRPDPAVTRIVTPWHGWIILLGDDAARGSRGVDVCHAPSGSGWGTACSLAKETGWGAASLPMGTGWETACRSLTLKGLGSAYRWPTVQS